MSAVLDLDRVVRRHALLGRLHQVEPELVALVAPAGFGKSTLAQQFVAERGPAGLCECGAVTDDVDFARRIVSALADESPERGAALSQRELLLADGALSRAERVALALEAWRLPPAQPTTFVFEDAEQLEPAGPARDFFHRLLAERPHGRALVLCSRENLRVHLTRFAAPHRVITLRADELAFTRDELALVFEPLALAAETVDRIFEASQGWPVPVLFLARLAQEGRHEEALERMGGVAFEALHEYLADQVLSALSPQVEAALFAAACIPSATRNDVVAATGDDSADTLLGEFGRTVPFVRSVFGTFTVHPLMRAMLRDGAEARRRALLEATARAHDEGGDHLRAAELYLALPDQEAAARSLEQVAVGEDRAPSMRYSRMVAALDRSVVRRYPTLWACSALLQTFSADSAQLLEETGSLWATLPPETPEHKRYYVIATRTLLLSYLGMFEEALALLDRVAPRAAIPAPPATREHGYALYLRATIIARMGRLDEADADLEAAWTLIEPMDAMASAALMIRGAEIARVRGERDREREFLTRSLEYARRSALSNFVVFRLAEAAFGAWFAGEDDAYSEAGDELGGIVDHDGIRGFRFFVSALRSEADVAPQAVDLPRWIVCGHLIAASRCAQPSDARAHAAAADAAAERYGNPFLRALAALARAELSDAERALFYERALGFAAQAGSAPFAEAVAAARDGRRAGMLHPFIARFRAGGAPAAPRLSISLVTGEVTCGGRPVQLAERELELLLLLARRRETVSRDDLTETLWPERDPTATANALKVHLHRLRARLGDEGAVTRNRDGLRLCDEARVDLWEIERAVATRRTTAIANDPERDEMLAAYDRLRGAPGARMQRWEWFERIDRSIRELRCELAQRLARYALESGDTARALELTHEMIDLDPCDEAAREIAISAYMRLGDRAAALRHYRQYRDVLAEELACEPSASIAALVAAQADVP